MAEEAAAEPITREQAEAFLADLSALAQRHGIVVGSCGLPWLERKTGRYKACPPKREGWDWSDVEFVPDKEQP